jgi:hypothetical protein
MELDKNSPAYKALMMVAVRAEVKNGHPPPYHSKFHYTDVAAMTANLLEINARMKDGVPLTRHEQALTFIAAIGHDLDHNGRGNPPIDPFYNEKKSFRLMQPLLKKAGLSAEDIHKIYLILMTTSPNGPHAVLKGIAHAQRKGEKPDFFRLDPEDKFLELRVLAADPKLTQMAAIVSDSDLYASSGAGMASSAVMSGLLTLEMKRAGVNVDLTTDSARKFFFDTIVGQEGYASRAGRLAANDSFEALRAENERRLAAAAKDKKPKGP